MNLVVTWKLNFATCFSFCGNRSHIRRLNPCLIISIKNAQQNNEKAVEMRSKCRVFFLWKNHEFCKKSALSEKLITRTNVTEIFLKSKNKSIPFIWYQICHIIRKHRSLCEDYLVVPPPYVKKTCCQKEAEAVETSKMQVCWSFSRLK